jgi:phosphate transport system substrate-binding protein
MAGKNETPALIGALMITVGLIGGGVWFLGKSGVLNNFGQGSPSASKPAPGNANNANSNAAANGQGQFAQVQNIPTGRFNYGGSTTFAPIRAAVDSAIQAARPEFNLQYVHPVGGNASSGEGLRMLLNRQLDFAQLSRPLTSNDQKQASSLNVKLQETPIAIDGIAIAVHPSLSIPGLTIDQIKGIYLGQIQNWQEVGGPDRPITPISRKMGSGGTVDLFQETVLGGGSLGSNVTLVNTTTEALQKLGQENGGIYYASAPEVVPQCSVRPLPIGQSANQLVAPYNEPLVPSSQCPNQRNQLNEPALRSGAYPLTRNLYIVWKADNGRSQQAGQAYLELLKTQQAKDLLLKAGFVPL